LQENRHFPFKCRKIAIILLLNTDYDVAIPKLNTILFCELAKFSLPCDLDGVIVKTRRRGLELVGGVNKF
jgi:hypothetical protein